MSAENHNNDRNRATVALVDWSHMIEDILDNLGVDLDTFREKFRGSWIFGYIKALQTAQIRTVWFCFSGRVDAPRYFTHTPSGGTICLLPVPASYRKLRRWILNPYAETIEQAAGEFHGLKRLGLSAAKEIMPYLATPLRCLAGEIRAQHCSAILCQEYEHARFDLCAALGRLLRLPVFASFQGGNSRLSRFEFLLRRFALRSCAGFIIAPQSEADRVFSQYRLPSTKVARIFNPIETAEWQRVDRDEARQRLGWPRDARIAAWHGRMEFHRKGLDILVAAWRRLCSEGLSQNRRLILIGTGHDDDAAALRRQIMTLPEERILWVNRFVNDPREIQLYLSAADVYVFPSRHEGFALAPIEAMACSLPVVASNALGIADMFPGGEASGGLIVPRENPQALAAAVDRLFNDPAWAKTVGRRGRQRAEAVFSLDAVGGQLRSFLSSHGAQFAAGPSPIRSTRCPVGLSTADRSMKTVEE